MVDATLILYDPHALDPQRSMQIHSVAPGKIE